MESIRGEYGQIFKHFYGIVEVEMLPGGGTSHAGTKETFISSDANGMISITNSLHSPPKLSRRSKNTANVEKNKEPGIDQAIVAARLRLNLEEIRLSQRFQFLK